MKTTNNPPLTEKEMEEREAKVRALLASAYPAAEPSPALRARVARHAQQYAQTNPNSAKVSPWFPRFAPRRIGWGVAAAVGVSLVTATVAIYPRWAAAKSLEKIQAAMLQVKNAHVATVEAGQFGGPDRLTEMWQSGTNSRTDESRRDKAGDVHLTKRDILTGGKLYQFDPENNRVTVRRSNRYYRFQPSGFTVADMKSDYLRWGWKDAIRDLGVTMWNGRLGKQVSIEKPEGNGGGRILLLIDPATDLPFRYEWQLKQPENGAWESRIIGDMEYNAVQPADLFSPRFRSGATMVDWDAERGKVRERLSKGIAAKTLPGNRRIVVRSVQANRDGTIFLLYTAGKRPGDQFLSEARLAGRDWRIELTDNQGNAYLSADPPVFTLDAENGDAQGNLVYDGERLEADVFVPQQRLSPSPSRRLNVTFRVNPVNLHGSGWGKVNLTENAAFELPIEGISAGLAPEFAPYAGINLDEDAVARLQADARGELPPGVKPSAELIGEFAVLSEGPRTLAFSPDRQSLAAGTWPDGVHLWNLADGRQIREFPTARPGSGVAAFSSDGSRLAILTDVYEEKKRRYTHTDIQVFAAASGRKIWTKRVECDDRSGLGDPYFTPDGKTLAAAGFHADAMERGPDGGNYIARMSGRVTRWDADTGAEKGVVAVGESGFHPALTPAQDRLITLESLYETNTVGGRVGKRVVGARAKIWDARSGALLRDLPVPPDVNLGIVKTSRDGSLIAASGAEVGPTGDGIVLIWDAATGELRHTLRGKCSITQDIALSPDNGLIIAAGGADFKTIEVWNLRTGRPSAPLVGHGSNVLTLAFSPDGQMFASSDWKGRILLWRTPAH